jgi:hypothetical protein
MQSQLSSSELISITRDATAFFGRRPQQRFRSASEAQAYRKMLTIAAGVNGPGPVSAVITTLQAAAACPRPVTRSVVPIVEERKIEVEDTEIEEAYDPIEDLSVDIVPVPAVTEAVAREARIDALWELQTYTAPAPKTATAPGFGGSGGLSGDIAEGLAGPVTVKPFTQVNPMRAGGQTT